jgi:hypothetical protein
MLIIAFDFSIAVNPVPIIVNPIPMGEVNISIVEPDILVITLAVFNRKNGVYIIDNEFIQEIITGRTQHAEHKAQLTVYH